MRVARSFFDTGWLGFVVAFAGGPYVIWLGWQELRLDGADVASTCTVLETSTRQGKGTLDFVPQVRLAHEVAGQRYERLDEGEQRSENDAARALAPFPAGAKVPCRYVEGRPDLIVAVEGRRPAGFMVAVGIVLLLIGLGGGVAIRKRRLPQA
jgi:hypothetical protein